MNKERLFDSFSHLDEELIERSEAVKPRAARQKWAGMAACLALITALAVPAVVRASPRGSRITTLRPDETWEDIVQSYDPDAVDPGINTPAVGKADNWDTPSVIGSPAILSTDAAAEIPILPWVESYPTDAEACYVPPKNGEVNLSVPLREAMDEYGDDARYRVVVDRFRNEQPLDPTGDEVEAEMDRLAAVGIVNAYERFYDHDVLERAYFTIHASRYELEHFPASDDYGYMLFLYAERVPDYEPHETEMFSSANSAVDEAAAVTPPTPTSEICGLPPAEETPR